MLYTIGINTLDIAHQVDVAFALEYFEDYNEIQFDTETTGLNPHINDLMCFQLGDFDNQFVIHKDYLPYFKEILETKTLIGQNLKFDLRFLYKKNIWPTAVYDTFLAESVISCGIIRPKNLAAIAKNRLGIELDKSIRDTISSKGLTPETVIYAANDVKYLEQIKDSQKEDLDRLELHKALMIENEFVLCLAYIEFCGFKLDRVKWQAKCDKDLVNFHKAKDELDSFVIKNHPKFVDNQLDLFTSDLYCKINWSSPKQVAEFFKYLGIPVVADDGGESVGEKNIAKYQKEFPIVFTYLEYKGYEKLIGTYGENFFNHISPVTGRLHTQFKQLMDTGRLSSGGKNKETKEEYINFQNIPSDKETRACFVAEEGNTLLISDYSGQEQIVLANNSMDAGLLEFYDKGLSDMHSFVASKMFEELRELDLDLIKVNHKDKRQAAKTAGFAINYGGNGSTIARNNNLTEEEGAFIYNSYFEAFPLLRDYFLEVQTQALRDGYVLISRRTGRKCFIAGYENFIETKKLFTREFWENYKRLKKSNSPAFEAMREKVSKWFKFKGQIERMALNFPIQGQSAEITKISGIYFIRWLRANNLFNIVKFANTIHDEHVVECPDNIVEEVSKALEKCMNDAALLYCKRVLLIAVPEASKFWKK